MNKVCLILLFCTITCIACKPDSKQTGKDVVMDATSRQMSDISLTQDDISRPDAFPTREYSIDKEKSREKNSVSNIRDSISLLLYSMHEKDIENMDIKIEKISEIKLFWSDPGYVEGPNIKVNRTCYVVCYGTTTYDKDGSVKYKDSYSYVFSQDGKFNFRCNRYSGKGYHGGSKILLVEEQDTTYNDIPRVLRPIINEREKAISRTLRSTRD